MTTRVTITTIGGAYAGETWTGVLSDAPATALIPEGIVSARTLDEGDRMRASIAALLDGDPLLDRVEVGAANWAIRVTREVA